MKKRITTIVLTAMLAVCVFSLVACGDDDNDNSIVDVAGKTYVFESIEITDYGTSDEEERNSLDKTLNVMRNAYDGTVIRFLADGIVSTNSSSFGSFTQGTYECENNKITLTFDQVPVPLECEINGNILKASQVYNDEGAIVTITYIAEE